MNLKINNSIFLGLVTICFIAATASVYENNNGFNIGRSEFLTYALLQLFGLFAYILISFQLILGGFYHKAIQLLGSKAYRYHIVFGLTAFFFMIIHPLMNGLSTYLLSNNIRDIFSLLPQIPVDRYTFFVSLGRTAFYLLSLSIFVAFFRTKFFRKNWLKAHYLNYLAYPLLVLHSKYLGVNVNTSFGVVYFLLTVMGLSSVIFVVYRFTGKLTKMYRKSGATV